MNCLKMIDGIKCPCCGRRALVRGVCNATFMAAKRMVDRKEITWEELEAKGTIGPAKTRKGSRMTKRVKYLLGYADEVLNGGENSKTKSNHRDEQPRAQALAAHNNRNGSGCAQEDCPSGVDA